MIGRYERRNLLVHEIELLAMLLRNEIADIIQDEFVREVIHLVYEEARRCCEGCETDDPMHHDCMMKEKEESPTKKKQTTKHLNVDRLWLAIEEQVHKTIRCLSGGLVGEAFTSPCKSG